MGPDLQIASNTSHHLLVSSPQMFFWSGTYIFVVVELVLSVVVARLLPGSRGPLVRTLVYLLPLTGVLTLLVALGWTNTLDINWDAGTVTTTNRFLLGYSNTHALATGDVDRALIDYDRMGPRVALALRGGGTLLPLGTISMYKPSQYRVLEAINDGLKGRTPAAPSGQDTDPASSPAEGSSVGSSGVSRMLEQQRALEEKLKRQKAEGGRP